MKLENQVCNLENAKKLKELGVKQDSLWWWVKCWTANGYVWKLFQKDEDDKVNEHISAFTCAELGEMLPKFIGTHKDMLGDWVCRSVKNLGAKFFRANAEVDARAKMLIYLLEKKLLNNGDEK